MLPSRVTTTTDARTPTIAILAPWLRRSSSSPRRSSAREFLVGIRRAAFPTSYTSRPSAVVDGEPRRHWCQGGSLGARPSVVKIDGATCALTPACCSRCDRSESVPYTLSGVPEGRDEAGRPPLKSLFHLGFAQIQRASNLVEAAPCAVWWPLGERRICLPTLLGRHD